MNYIVYWKGSMADDRTGGVRDVFSMLLSQSIAIDERFLCGYRLAIDWPIPIDTNWYRLIDGISNRLDIPGICVVLILEAYFMTLWLADSSQVFVNTMNK